MGRSFGRVDECGWAWEDWDRTPGRATLKIEAAQDAVRLRCLQVIEGYIVIMLRIAFLGTINTFEFDHIGGACSLVRRLALTLAAMGDHVDLVQYGTAENMCFEICKNIRQRNFRTFSEMLTGLEGRYDHVVSVYIRSGDRISFARFRKAQQRSTSFHQFYLNRSESWLKRKLYFAEARLFGFNGSLFCISPRIHRSVSKWSSRGRLLLPSVPENYFLKPREKRSGSKIRIAYVGRVDPGKGTMAAVEVIRRLASEVDIEARVCGFAWSRLPDTMSLHNELLSDPDIKYESVEPDKWTSATDDRLCALLRETDILLLPYEKLSSTTDTPLLLLEGMANLCAVVTPPLGDMPDIYGRSRFSLSDGWDIDLVTELIKNAREYLPAERERLFKQNQKLNFSSQHITELFRNCLLGNN